MTDLEGLPSLKEIRAKAQPKRLICCVYFLFNKGDLIYIGKASNLFERIGQHMRDKQFDFFSYVEVEPARALMIEARYILALKPTLNKALSLPGRPVMLLHAHNKAESSVALRQLRLKAVLEKAGLTSEKWATAIIQTGGRGDGRPLSATAVAQIINWNIWPKLTPKEHIQAQTEKLLRAAGVPENEIQTVWEPVSLDPPPPYRPIGTGSICCHVNMLDRKFVAEAR